MNDGFGQPTLFRFAWQVWGQCCARGPDRQPRPRLRRRRANGTGRLEECFRRHEMGECCRESVIASEPRMPGSVLDKAGTVAAFGGADNRRALRSRCRRNALGLARYAT
jgi:hypothetical protein